MALGATCCVRSKHASPGNSGQVKKVPRCRRETAPGTRRVTPATRRVSALGAYSVLTRCTRCVLGAYSVHWVRTCASSAHSARARCTRCILGAYSVHSVHSMRAQRAVADRGRNVNQAHRQRLGNFSILALSCTKPGLRVIDSHKNTICTTSYATRQEQVVISRHANPQQLEERTNPGGHLCLSGKIHKCFILTVPQFIYTFMYIICLFACLLLLVCLCVCLVVWLLVHLSVLFHSPLSVAFHICVCNWY